MEQNIFSSFGLKDPLAAISMAQAEARQKRLQLVTLDYSYNLGQMYKDALGRTGEVMTQEFKTLKQKAQEGKLVLCVIYSEGDFKAKTAFRNRKQVKFRNISKRAKIWNRRRRHRAC